MKSTRIFVIAIIITVFFACPLAVTAGMHRGFMGLSDKGQGLIGVKTFLELKLTPAQQNEILELISGHEREGVTLRHENREAMRKLADVMRAEDFDETALRGAYREVSSAREEMLVFRGRLMQELKNLLTSEQREILDRMKAERRGKWAERMRPLQQTENE